MAAIGLLAVGFIMKVIAVLFVICAVALVLIILIQKGRGGGLSGALTGGMASGILGSKTGDFLTWVTISLVAVFLLLSVVLAKFYRPAISGSDEAAVPSQQEPASKPPSAEPATLPGDMAGLADTESVDVNAVE